MNRKKSEKLSKKVSKDFPKSLPDYVHLPLNFTKHQYPQLRLFCDAYTRRIYLDTGVAPRECKIETYDFIRMAKPLDFV